MEINFLKISLTFHEFPWLQKNSKFPWLILKFPDFTLTLNFPDFSLTSGNPEEDIFPKMYKMDLKTISFLCLIVIIHFTYYIWTIFTGLNAKKRENNNEGFDNLHVLLMIHVYALAKICQVE